MASIRVQGQEKRHRRIGHEVIVVDRSRTYLQWYYQNRWKPPQRRTSQHSQSNRKIRHRWWWWWWWRRLCHSVLSKWVCRCLHAYRSSCCSSSCSSPRRTSTSTSTSRQCRRWRGRRWQTFRPLLCRPRCCYFYFCFYLSLIMVLCSHSERHVKSGHTPHITLPVSTQLI